MSIITAEGIKIEFKKIDELVIQIRVSTNYDKIITMAVFTIDQLKDEIAILERQ